MPTNRIPETFGIISTFSDLELERDEVMSALVKQVKKVVCLRDGASSKTPIEVCRQEVQEYDAMIVILAYRYGSPVPGMSISYTELEILEALRHNIPILAYFLCPEQGKKAEIDYEYDTYEQRQRLKEFLGKFVKMGKFKNAKDLARQVIADLDRLNKDFNDFTRSHKAVKRLVAGDLLEDAEFSVMIETPATYENIPSELSKIQELEDFTSRSFCLVNGIPDNALWIYFREEQISKIDWSQPSLTKISCKPMLDGDRKGLIVGQILTPVDSPAQYMTGAIPLRIVK